MLKNLLSFLCFILCISLGFAQPKNNDNSPSSLFDKEVIITGKVFEYLQSKRPIIGIGPVNGDLAEILKETGAGEMFDFKDVESLKQSLIS